MDQVERVLIQAHSHAFDSTTTRTLHRVSTVLATNIDSRAITSAKGTAPSQYLYFGRLARFYDGCVEQLPKILVSQWLDAATFTLNRWKSEEVDLVRGRLWIFECPAAPLVIVLTVEVECPSLQLIPLLEDCYYRDIKYGDFDLPTLAANLLERSGMPLKKNVELAIEAECHQQIYLATEPNIPLPDDDQLQRLIYRADLDCRPEYSCIQRPTELNRRPRSLSALGPFVSVFAAQQDYIENCALLSAVQLVAASAKARQIRSHTYETLQKVDEVTSSRGVEVSIRERRTAREMLARAAERLSEEELQLTFGVESACRLELLVPSLRVDAYHAELSQALGLADSAATVSDMLSRLTKAIAAEVASLMAFNARREELRRLRWGAAVGIFSTVAVTVGIVLSFFSIQASQVHPDTSMFNWHLYHGLYLFIIVIWLLSGTAFAFFLRRERHELRTMLGSK